MRAFLPRLTVLVLVSVSLLGCSSGSDGGKSRRAARDGGADAAVEPPSGHVDGGPAPVVDSGPEGGKKPHVGTGANVAGVVTAEKGGTVTLPSGASLKVPPGAIAKTTTITLTETTDLPPDGYETYSPVYQLEPEGTTFEKPVTITLPYDGDAKLATLFWSKEASSGTTGWDWVGGAVSSGKVSATIQHFSKGFVANGVDYSEPPDLSCVSTALLEGRTVYPSGVALFFTAQDCWGRTITDLQCDDYRKSCDFALEEDDKGPKLSVEAQPTILEQKGVEPFARLSLDMSSSTAGVVDSLIAGAKQFVTKIRVDEKLPVHIAIDLFDRTNVTEWQPSTLDTDLVLAKLDALATYVAPDPNGTNLYGGVILGLERLARDEADFRQRNLGGAFTAGYLVLFTDGADTAGIATEKQALDHEKYLSRSEPGRVDDIPTPIPDGWPTNPDQVIAVGLQTADFDGDALDRLAPNAVLASPNPENLSNAFGALAHRIAGQVQRTYLLGYCTPKAAGTHTVSVSIDGRKNQDTAVYSFSASGSSGCSTDVFTKACDGKRCGGLGCGACDDRSDSCDGETSQCVSYCASQKKCGGTVIQNPNGYTQTCDDSAQSTSCARGCVDTTKDSANCGACGKSCGIGFCVDAKCSCDPPPESNSTPPEGGQRLLCNGTCIDGSSDAKNCGACGKACAAGLLCEEGACVCPGGQTLTNGICCAAGTTGCDGACVHTLTDMANCGACGKTCTAEQYCVTGACVCLRSMTLCGDDCADLTSDVDNCGACGAKCAGTCSAGHCITTLASGLKTTNGIGVDARGVYWTDAAGIERVPLGGGTATVVSKGVMGMFSVVGTDLYTVEGSNLIKVAVASGAQSTLFSAAPSSHVVADASHVCWVGADGIGECAAVASGAPVQKDAFIFDAKRALRSIALDSTNAYWALQPQGTICKVGLNGTLSTALASRTGPNAIATDGVRVYWTENAGLASIPVGGGTVTTHGGLSSPYGAIAMDATSVYWTTIDRLWKTSISTGTSTIVTYIPEDTVLDLAVDASSVYLMSTSGGLSTIQKVTPK